MKRGAFILLEGVSAVALTKDHNIREPEELKKLKAAHPSGRGAGP